MKALEARNRINELMALFVTQVKGATAMGQSDINRVAETVLIPLFREIYGLKDLQNLNLEKSNFPGVDLGDAKKKVAIQVTSTAEAAKIKKTLEKFVAHDLHKRYNRVIVYILTEKQNTYTGKGFDDILGNVLVFDKENDIHDFTDVLQVISNWQLPRVQKVLAILEANFGSGNSLVLEETPPVNTETLFLNLLEISFPDTLYVADLSEDLKKSARALEGSRGRGGRFRGPKKQRPPSPRERVTQFLHDQGLRFAVDWQYHAGQILTFHDLEDTDLPLARTVEPGTVTALDPMDFYLQGEAEENVFRSLLHRCLQQKLYRDSVQWQNDVDLFIFCPFEKEEVRKEKWFGRKSNTREVYKKVYKDPKKMKKRDDGREPNPLLHHKHFGFYNQFLRVGNQWYLMLAPDWFFSFDGYKPSFYDADNAAWVKRHETNQSVFNHVRFLTEFLKREKSANLFEEARPYRFLTFGQLLRQGGAPQITDKDWLPNESKSKQKRIKAAESDETLNLFMSQPSSGSDDSDDEDEENEA